MRCEWQETDNPVYNRLMKQFVERVARYARGSSYGYRQAKFLKFKLFLEYTSEWYDLQDIRNIQPKHVAAFIRRRKEKGISRSTILKDISYIRFWHKMIPRAQYVIPDNEQLFYLADNMNKNLCDEFRDNYRLKGYQRKDGAHKKYGSLANIAPTGQGSYKNLLNQLNKVYRKLLHSKDRGVSRDTLQQYRYKTCKILAFLAEQFKLQKMVNVSEKHLQAYVEHRRAGGAKDTAIKQEISALKYFLQNMEEWQEKEERRMRKLKLVQDSDSADAAAVSQ